MKKVLALAAVGEAATGLILIAYPPIVVRLLCGLEVSGSGVILSRIFGISLVAIGVACWPAEGSAQPLFGMLTYTALATVYMVVFGLGGSAGHSVMASRFAPCGSDSSSGRRVVETTKESGHVGAHFGSLIDTTHAEHSRV